MSKKTKPSGSSKTARLEVSSEDGISAKQRLANVSLDPSAHGMSVARMYNQGSFGEQHIEETYEAMLKLGASAKKGELGHQKAMLAGQADALNSIFTELSRRAAHNMGEYIGATEKYLRLGLKAQAQCRATIEALDKLTSGRVQTVRHVHVNEGGQAVIADEFHNHTGGTKNDKSNEQPHATGPAGESSEMLGADADGDGVPISSREGAEKVQNARGQGQRRA